jgi:dTMP kinase
LGQPPLTARGYFITLEGGEGAGKSTQAKMLVAALERAGIPARFTREPGGSPGAEAIRQLLIEGDTERWDAASEALLLYAARREHVTRLIQPALAAGTWVICDRFNDSTIAYQGYGRGVPLDELAMLQRFALGDFVPDMTLILDLAVDNGFARAALRPRRADRFERLDRAFHERLRQGFHAIATAEPGRCVTIDASGNVSHVQSAIAAIIAERFGVMLT